MKTLFLVLLLSACARAETMAIGSCGIYSIDMSIEEAKQMATGNGCSLATLFDLSALVISKEKKQVGSMVFSDGHAVFVTRTLTTFDGMTHAEAFALVFRMMSNLDCLNTKVSFETFHESSPELISKAISFKCGGRTIDVRLNGRSDQQQDRFESVRMDETLTK